MCSYKHWYFDDEGYVLECEHCNSFQVCFGTTMLTLDAKNFAAFNRMVFYKKEKYAPVSNINAKCIILPTPDPAIHFIFTQNELDTLYNMLQEADTEMKTAQMIGLFNYAQEG